MTQLGLTPSRVGSGAAFNGGVLVEDFFNLREADAQLPSPYLTPQP